MQRKLSSGPTHYEEGAREVSFQYSIQDFIKGLETQLRNLADSIGAIDQVAIPLLSRSGAASEEEVRSLIRGRSQRDKFFPNDLFADPAWDMLLDLYVSEIIHRRVSVSSLCIASHVPSSTALRWITHLQCEGLVERTSDPFDKRRFLMTLTGKGREAMDAYFSSLLPVVPFSNELVAPS